MRHSESKRYRYQHPAGQQLWIYNAKYIISGVEYSENVDLNASKLQYSVYNI